MTLAAVLALPAGEAAARTHDAQTRAGPEGDLPDVTDVPDAEEGEPAGGESEPDPRVEQAMEAYRRGEENFNHAQYEAALADFKEASSLYASPAFQYNIGRCYEELGKYDEAIRAFSTYLKAKPDADDRANVENRITRLRELLEKQREEEAERSKPQVIVTPAVEDKAAKKRETGKRLVISGGVLLGVGGATALIGGIALGVLADGKARELRDVQNGGNADDLTFDDASTIADEGERFEAIQIGLIAGGAGVAVVGAVLLGVGFKLKKAKPDASATLVPQVGPGQAGLSLVGRF